MAKFSSNVRSMLLLGLVAALILTIVVLFSVGFVAAKRLSTNSGAIFVSKIVRLPIAKVGGYKILYADYIDDVFTLKRFYAQVGDIAGPVTDDQLSQQALSRLIANRIIQETAEENGIKVEQQDIDNMKSELFSQFDSEDAAKKDLQEKYGWSLEKYTNKVIVPIIFEQKLSEMFQNSDSADYDQYGSEEQVMASHILFTVEDGQDEAEVKKLAQAVLDEIKGGSDFAELAGKYGTDSTAEVGGDLGWFGRGVMIPEFEEAVFSLGADEFYAEPLKTQFGYHLIKKTGERTLRDFDAYITDKLEQADISIYSGLSNPFEAVTQEAAQ